MSKGGWTFVKVWLWCQGVKWAEKCEERWYNMRVLISKGFLSSGAANIGCSQK